MCSRLPAVLSLRRWMAMLPPAVNRNAHLDYGGVLVLAHSDDRGTPFYTLFGHLDPHSIAGLADGQAVKAGQQVARLGAAAVNGGVAAAFAFPDGALPA
jgi:hypothetical protein